MRKLLAASAILSADAAFVPAPMSASHDASNCGASAHSCRSGSARLVATMEEAGFAIKKAGSMSRDERLRSRYSGLKFVPEGGWADNAVDFSYDELSQSMNAIPTFSRGDVTTGSIIGFEPNGALVDIGVKSSAYVTLQEMALVKPDKPENCLALGAEYEFVIVSREDENGQLMLSRRRLLFDTAWESVAKLYADDAVVEGEVVAVNRGGAMMLVEGLRAFLPGSHFMAGQTPSEDFIGKKLKVKFLDVDKENSRLVVSYRKANADNQISDLTVGTVLKGVVTAVKPYGAFVDLGGMSGLIHISQISCDHSACRPFPSSPPLFLALRPCAPLALPLSSTCLPPTPASRRSSPLSLPAPPVPVSNVEAVIPVGTELKCMVISQDKGKGRVALSTKTLEREPGDMIKNQQSVFDNAEATAAMYQERLEAERKAREEAAQDVIFGLESVFADPTVPDAAAPAAAAIPFEE
jgi:predicted RNA-binding protein with RPS1 domain